MIKRINFVITSLAIYIVGLVMYVFRDNNGSFWVEYYWLLNSYLAIASLWIAFIGVKTVKEKIAVMFVLLSRIILSGYYLFCINYVHDQTVMEGYINFFIALMGAGFLSIYFRKKIHLWKIR